MTECNRCLINSEIPGAEIEGGSCRYCKIHDRLEKQYPISLESLLELAKKIKKAGKRKQYDCLIGISGGCDSSYLLHFAVKALKLRPLVIHFDNRWNTEQAEHNMKKIVDALDVDFIRYQLNKKMYDKLNRAFFEASVSDADIPNDMAMLAIFKNVAKQYKIKYVFNGHSFRTEGTAPLGWTYMDAKYIQSVYFSRWEEKIEGFPLLTFKKQLRWAFSGVKEVRPLYFLGTRKEQMKDLLAIEYDWQDYGGHHQENKYTAFVSSYLLPKKFGIDKRIIEYSAFIRSEYMTKSEAREKLKEEPYLAESVLSEIEEMYPDLDERMQDWMCSHTLYETYHKLFKRYRLLIWLAVKFHLLSEMFYLKYTRKE